MSSANRGEKKIPHTSAIATTHAADTVAIRVITSRRCACWRSFRRSLRSAVALSSLEPKTVAASDCPIGRRRISPLDGRAAASRRERRNSRLRSRLAARSSPASLPRRIRAARAPAEKRASRALPLSYPCIEAAATRGSSSAEACGASTTSSAPRRSSSGAASGALAGS